MRKIIRSNFKDHKNILDWTLLKLEKNIIYATNLICRALIKKNLILWCGNGGSAGNAIHLANDFLVGIASGDYVGMKVEALSANSAVLTCLGNDVGYSEIYAEQLLVKANSGDLLIVLSGSGNSPNVLRALEVGNSIGMKTFAILGYTGGRCRKLAQFPVHFEVNDMQISEDLQLIVGHMCMQWLCEKITNSAAV